MLQNRKIYEFYITLSFELFSFPAYLTFRILKGKAVINCIGVEV